jgi:hypothetical protein
MAAPVYATNLIDITLSQATTGFTAIGGGGAITAETDFYIQNGVCVSKATAATWDTAGTPRGGVLFNNGAGITVPADGAVLVWMYWWGSGALATKVNGGAEVNFGNLTTAYYGQYVSGSDDWAFGGWRCYPVDPNLTPRNRTVGAPNGTWQWFGWTANVGVAVSIGKGNPYGIDAIRYGRCDLVVTQGDLANGYATILGASDYDNTDTRRLGLLIPRDGAYYQQGLFQMGTAGTIVDFRDANRVIFIANTEKVSPNFNKFEIRNASSRVDWTSFSISALGTTSRGNFQVVDNADVNFDSCTFTDMGTFIFLSNTTIINSVFRRCAQITANSAVLTDCTITNYFGLVNTSALVWNTAVDTDGYLDGTTFIKGTASTHAIELGLASPTNITLRGVSSSGYNASNGQNDSTIHVKRTTGTVTINLIGTSGNFSYRTDGATVVLVIDPVTLTISCQDTEGNSIQDARVLVTAAAGGDYAFNDIVTITRSGSTATVAHTAHGMVNGDKVVIYGSIQNEYNGIKTISNVTINSYDFTVSGTPATPATGTITSTTVLISGLTDSNGEISDTRSYTSSQPITGRVRKSTSAPYYKTGNIVGTVSNTSGATITIVMLSDE